MIDTQFLTSNSEQLRKAARLLQLGEVVGMPTETVYGLAGGVFNYGALTKIFEAKERPSFDPLIVHIAPIDRFSQVGTNSLSRLYALGLVDLMRMSALARERANVLMHRFWPGPLTLVLPKLPQVPDLCTSGLPTVAVRMPGHPIAQELIRLAGMPLAAPSANRFGRISPTRATAVWEELSGRIAAIIDGGECEVGLESTVVSIAENGQVNLLRHGAITAEQMQEVIHEEIGNEKVPTLKMAEQATAHHSPGMLEKHYAPKTPLRLFGEAIDEQGDVFSNLLNLRNELLAGMGSAQLTPTVALLLQSGSPERAALWREQVEKALQISVLRVTVLSESGELGARAHRLFSAMRELDQSGAGLILAEQCSQKLGLGYAISDRLNRASR